MRINVKKIEGQKIKKRLMAVMLVIGASAVFAACTNNESARSQTAAYSETKVDTGYEATYSDSFDSADTPILISKNTEEKTVTFLNMDIGRRYTLSYDGTTKFFNKYGEGISFEQIAEGDVVDITFLKSDKHLTTMTLAGNAWHYDNVEKFEFNNIKKEVSIGDETYKLSDNTVYISGGHMIEEMELNAADVLSFQGIDKTVFSVTVEKGHGYLRLANSESFVGGWIEIGQAQIQRITEDMLLTVPEGSYQVNISYKGSGGIKNVIINRDEETTLDISDLQIEEARMGTIVFSLSPTDAELYVDGTQVDTSQPLSLEYGIHQLIARADGYQSLTQYLRVGDESAGVNIVLDAVNSTTDESTSSSDSSSSSDSTESTVSSTESTSTTSATETTTGTTAVDTTTDYYKVYIDAPEGAEVYLDGNYVGISPCSFKKTSGSHVITLRKSGYETRSYTVQVDDEDKDISYSFTDLDESSSQSVESLVSEALNTILNN
jgi:hypothetical protein